ncbi:MAG TPA: hypothetical protein VMZ31_11155 [Phycisphaerae bacterium]|nr:hypothetical protein [Phycisphaerae bacterium]
MKMLRFLQGAYRRALIVAAGGSLYLLSDCDDEVRASVIAQTGGVVTAIIDAILNAAVNAVTNPPPT